MSEIVINSRAVARFKFSHFDKFEAHNRTPLHILNVIANAGKLIALADRYEACNPQRLIHVTLGTNYIYDKTMESIFRKSNLSDCKNQTIICT
jgi:hypothetical protein